MMLLFHSHLKVGERLRMAHFVTPELQVLPSVFCCLCCFPFLFFLHFSSIWYMVVSPARAVLVALFRLASAVILSSSCVVLSYCYLLRDLFIYLFSRVIGAFSLPRKQQ